jgi:hypothetical protein
MKKFNQPYHTLLTMAQQNILREAALSERLDFVEREIETVKGLTPDKFFREDDVEALRNRMFYDEPSPAGKPMQIAGFIRPAPKRM